MSVKIAICDDSQEDINKLSALLSAYNDSFQITEYRNGEFLAADCLEHEALYDILFLDIYMPELNGIATAAKIRAAMKNVIIIFVSSSKDHYSEAFNVFAFNYITKPIDAVKLQSVLDQALMNFNMEQGHYIEFSFKTKSYRVLCRDILYLESSDKILLFHMKDKSILQCYSKLDDMLKQLPVELFIRCHQSYVVNVYHVTEIAKNHIRIGSAAINISKRYQKEAKDKYFNYLFKNMNTLGL